MGKVFITQYKYILIVSWAKTSQPSSLSGYALLYSWSINSWQTVHPPGPKEKLHNNEHAFSLRAMSCTCYLATFTAVHDLWMTNGVSLYQTMKQKYPSITKCPLSPSYSFLFFSFDIRNDYTQLPHFADEKIETQNG